MRGMEVSWWMVERAWEAEERASCRVSWKQLGKRGGRGRNDEGEEKDGSRKEGDWKGVKVGKKERGGGGRMEDKEERTDIKDQRLALQCINTFRLLYCTQAVGEAAVLQ